MADTKQVPVLPSLDSGSNSHLLSDSFGPVDNSDPAVQNVHRVISGAASRNTELLLELSSTADAPGLYANNETAQRHANRRLKQQKEEVELATVGSKLQLEQHKKFRDPSLRKLYYAIRRKRMRFEEKASVEEKRYLETLERRRKAEEGLTEVQAEVTFLEHEGRVLKAKFARHRAAHEAIDRLYASIFDGPTPGFPLEDTQEHKHVKARSEHEQAMGKTMATVQGRKAAEAVARALERAVHEAKAAVDERNRRGMVPVIPPKLRRCRIHVINAMDFSDRVLAGLTEPIWPVLLEAKRNLDLILQAVISSPIDRSVLSADPSIPARILALLSDEAQPAQVRLLEVVIAASEAQRHRVRGTARRLEDDRQALQQIRQAAFEQTVGFGEAAPAYNECCDRAEAYEGEVDVLCATVQDVVIPDVEESDGAPPEYEHNTVMEAGGSEVELHTPVMTRRPTPGAA